MKRIPIARSRKLLRYLLILHSLVWVTLLSLLGLSWWSLLVTLLVMLSFVYYAQQHQWLKAKKSVITIEYDVDKGWSLYFADGSVATDRKLTSSFVTPLLVMLYFDSRFFWQCNVITIVDDAVDAELFRQLRVYLRAPRTYQE